MTQLGQYYTTNYEYILQGMDIPLNVSKIIEPFVGTGELLQFIKRDVELMLYDIDVKEIPDKIVKQRDTLLNPPKYDDCYVITNPPFLAKNKNKLERNNMIYKKYETDDLYKCFIKSLLNSVCMGGIIILPSNFITSYKKSDVLLRSMFFKTYHIQKMNVFEEIVFDDTSYAICSMQFLKHSDEFENIPTNIKFYPSNDVMEFVFNEINHTIGQEVVELNNVLNITRVTNDKDTTNIVVHCIDNSGTDKICFKIGEPYIDNTPKLSARTFMTPLINISLIMQIKLVKSANKYLNDKRKQYHSMFLTTYREKSRKRISFEMAYGILCKCLMELMASKIVKFLRKYIKNISITKHKLETTKRIDIMTGKMIDDFGNILLVTQNFNN